MQSAILNQTKTKKIIPPCSVFGKCGGCQYQDIPYDQELEIKENCFKQILSEQIDFDESQLAKIVPSPEIYHYRNRIDLNLLKTKRFGTIIGFASTDSFRVAAVEECPIAMPAISDAIPQIKAQALAKLPEKYRTANLVVKTGNDGRVLWGGIGRRSLHLEQKDYLWTDVDETRVFYSLDTFFQANLSILPKVIECFRGIIPADGQMVFLDLYGGVGLFGFCMASSMNKVYLIEDNPTSVKLAQYNRQYNKKENFEIIEGRVEDQLPLLFEKTSGERKVVLVDPPRAGLSHSILKFLCENNNLEQLLYLSCNPHALARDLKELTAGSFKINKMCPFDFFPRTKHIEALVTLQAVQ